MPTLAVAKDFLFRLIGKSFTDPEFDNMCFEFGIELDDITSEKEMYMREQAKSSENKVTAEKLSEEVIYKIETPANRYDLLSAESMATALRVFLGIAPLPAFRVLHRESPLYHMAVRRSVKNVRDYVVCAVLRNIKFNEYSYNSFIDFQEKLHSGLARRRTLASAGTHDLDKIGTDKFSYTAWPKEKIQFVPLRQTKVLDCTGDGLAAYYAEDRHISKYVPLISSMPCYPLIMDASEKHVLSMPPIINSAYSSMSKDTKNIFIECTAPDHYKAQVLVNQLVCAFSMYCEEPFTVEAVQVDYEEEAPDGTKSEVCPNLDPSEITINRNKMSDLIGVHIDSSEKCAEYLTRMMYEVKEIKGDELVVSVPAVRSDVLGYADLMEDVAIGYGYSNIKYIECTTHGEVTQLPHSKVSQLLRIEMASAGYMEILAFSLCSHENAFAQLGRVDNDVAVHIGNPQTIEFQICRPSLMPGLLKTLVANKSQPMPQRYFECSDVVLIDNEQNFPPVLEVPDRYPTPGARNQLHVAALHCNSNSSSFEEIHSLAAFMLMKLGVPRKGSEKEGHKGDVYTMESGEDGAYFPGRTMIVYVHRKGQKVRIGEFGVLHPNTLEAYGIPFPCSFVELNVQFLCVAAE